MDLSSSNNNKQGGNHGGCLGGSQQQGGCFGFMRLKTPWDTESYQSSSSSSASSTDEGAAADHHIPDYEKLLAHSMSRLSVADREQVMNDLHAVPEPLEETPEMMNELLDQLEEALQERKREHASPVLSNLDPKATKTVGTEAYFLAELMDRQYVFDRERRCQFLRADRYQPQEAADRLIRYFATKSKLFGTDKLTTDIRLDDLEEEALQVLQSGAYQESPVQDSAGRTIVLYIMSLRSYTNPDSVVSFGMFYYVLIVISSTAQTNVSCSPS